METNDFLQSTTLVVCLFIALAARAEDHLDAPDRLPSYTIKYPVADRFCPPIRSTFYEVTRNLMIVNGKRIRQKTNGGYGLPVDLKVEGKNMLHVGADLGWQQVNEPVFAVASGIVRISMGPDLARNKKGAGRVKPASQPGDLQWGNFVVIEHQTEEGEYFTTLYGHLATKRFVRAGDIVSAGQPIGTIGRQHLRINGGYKPHLHFGVRRGRMLEKGAPLMHLLGPDGSKAIIRVAEIGEEMIEVEVPEGMPSEFEITTNAGKVILSKRDDKYFVPSWIFWRYQRPDFALVGYSLTTDGWLDPIAFLIEQRADTLPAPYLPLTTRP